MDNKNEDIELLDNDDQIEKVEEKPSKYDGMPSRLDVFDINKEEMVEQAKKEQIQEEIKEKSKENIESTPKPKKSKKTLIIIIIILFLVLSSIAVTYAIEVYNEKNYEPQIKKPIIYIYPEKDMDIKVTLSNPEKLTVSYPKYNNGWEVHATPSGELTDKNGKQYYALYWEGETKNTGVKEDGFVVDGKDISAFLEEKLNILGLNYKESNEFIMYWLPKLEKNKYNYIRFKTMDEINESMELNIEPEPDTLIRVLMDYKPLNKKINVIEQKLTKVERYGYTVVEWGGTNVD